MIIESLNILIQASTAKLTQQLKAAQAKVHSFGASIKGAVGKAASGLGSGLVKAASAAKYGFIALAAAAAGAAAAVAKLTKDQFGEIDDIGKYASRIGISTEALIALQHQGEASGVGVETLNKALEKQVRNVSDAAQGTGTAVDAFKELGVSAAQLNQMAPEQQFGAIADSLLEVSNQSDRVRLASEIFGQRGTALVQMLGEGSITVAQFRQEAERLGITISEQDYSEVAAANDAWDRMGKSITGAFRQLAVIAAPVVTDIANMVTDFIVNSKGWFKSWGEYIVEVFNGVQYAIQTIGKRWNLIIDYLAFALLKRANDIANIFTNVIPTTFSAFYDYSLNLFSNLGENIASVWSNVWGWITGENASWDFNFKPLTEGLDEAFKKVEEAYDRPLTDAEQMLLDDITRQQNELDKGWEKFLNNKTKQEIENASKVANDFGRDINDAIDPQQDNKKQAASSPAALQRGSVEAFNQVLELQRGKQADPVVRAVMDQSKIAEKQTKVLERIEKALSKNELDVATLGV